MPDRSSAPRADRCETVTTPLRGIPGRPRATTRAELERVAFDLFERRGYDETNIEDIAQAAGISRRTLFRYVRSKADLVWGDFEAELERMAGFLAAMPTDRPAMEAVRRAAVDFNRLAPDQVPWHRRRMHLILETPALLASSTPRFAAWREVVARFVARRIGASYDDLVPSVVAHGALGACIAAYEQWLRDEDADLCTLISEAFLALEQECGRNGA